MNTADAAIFVFGLICMLRGLFRGPVNEFFSITAILGGMLVAAHYYAAFAWALPGWMGAVQWRYLGSFLFLFGGTYILMTVIGVIAAYLFRNRRSKGLSRVIGAGFGILKAILAIAALLIPLVAFLPKNSGWIGGSAILSYENRLSEKMTRVVPTALLEKFSSHIDDYKQAWLQNKMASHVR